MQALRCMFISCLRIYFETVSLISIPEYSPTTRTTAPSPLIPTAPSTPMVSLLTEVTLLPSEPPSNLCSRFPMRSLLTMLHRMSSISSYHSSYSRANADSSCSPRLYPILLLHLPLDLYCLSASITYQYDVRWSYRKFAFPIPPLLPLVASLRNLFRRFQSLTRFVPHRSSVLCTDGVSSLATRSLSLVSEDSATLVSFCPRPLLDSPCSLQPRLLLFAPSLLGVLDFFAEFDADSTFTASQQLSCSPPLWELKLPCFRTRPTRRRMRSRWELPISFAPPTRNGKSRWP